LSHLALAGAAVAKRILGVAFDSPVDFDGVPFGVSRALAGEEGTFKQQLYKAPMDLHSSPLLPFRQHLVASSVAMHGTDLGAFSSPLPLRSATLLYGPDDSVTSVPDINAFAQEWRDAGVDPVEEVW
jgi:hypothetical protein